MNNYDCFISDHDVKPGYVDSPGLSSGYCSGEEGITPTGSVFNLADCSSVNHITESDRTWNSPYCGTGFLGADPALNTERLTGNIGHTRFGGYTSSVDDFSCIKGSLSYEDLMDTMWDPFSEVSGAFSSCDTLVDIDIGDVNIQPARRASVATMGGHPVNLGDCGLLSLLKSSDWMPTGSNINYDEDMGSQAHPGVMQQNHWMPVNYNPGRNNVQNFHSPSAAAANPMMTSSSRSSCLTQAVSSLQQHMAGAVDLGNSCDASEYYLNLLQETCRNIPCSQSVQELNQNHNKHHNSTLFGGIFSRSPGKVPSGHMRPCEPRNFNAFHTGYEGPSGPAGLRHSRTIPTSLNGRPSPQGLTKCASEFVMKHDMAFHSGRQLERSPSYDMRGGCSSYTPQPLTLHPGLDDHRYTLKPKQQSMFGLNDSDFHTPTTNVQTDKSPSILEAFLRSNGSFDPNKGSNAALPTVGLGHLKCEQVDEGGVFEDPCLDTGAPTSLLLKKLLTGEMDQREVFESQERNIQNRLQSVSGSSTPTLSDSPSMMGLPMRPPGLDYPLSDDFGLDMDLALDDNQLLESINFLTTNDVAELTDNIWLGDINDELTGQVLDDILRSGEGRRTYGSLNTTRLPPGYETSYSPSIKPGE